MAAKGYFIITDISGYTEYLTRSELEHANETLQSLFDAQLAHIKFPLHIMEYDGMVTKFGIYVSKPDKEPPAGFRDFLESAARAGYERLTPTSSRYRKWKNYRAVRNSQWQLPIVERK